ncbi:MAG: ankyrin repeat domain-containing protein [Rickettsiaceae bacterium]|nr:ankyrin repeat domain-containing protein [Rickettsiaceae bacterium]
MLAQLTPDQMNNIVDQQINDLKKHGFNPAGIDMVGSATITDFDNLKTFINERLKTNIAGMNDVAEKTSIIAQFDVDKTFKNGGWVAAFAESGGLGPVLFAINNNITISGKNPLLWASENQYKTANEDLSSKIDAFTKANNISPTKSNRELLDAIKTKNTPAIQSIIQKGADIHAADVNGKTPLHYALENGKIEIFNTLLDKGADIHAADAN